MTVIGVARRMVDRQPWQVKRYGVEWMMAGGPRVGKISLLTLDYPPIEGGISRYLHDVVRRMPMGKIRIVGLSAPHHREFDELAVVAVERLPIPTRWRDFRWQLKFFAPIYLIGLLGHRDAECLLCGQAHYSIMIPAWMMSRLRNIPYGIFAHGLDILHPQTTKYGPIFNRLLRAADVVFANSLMTKQALLEIGVQPSRISLLYPGIQPARMTVLREQAVEVLQRHSLHGKKCILTVGRLVERKGQDVVIRAMPLVLAEVPTAHYLIVGRGAYEPALRRLVTELELEAHVTFAGFVEDDELPAYYAASELFVMTSRAIESRGDIEGFGIVFLEASLMGKPIVAGKSGGVTEAVLHNETGLLIDPNNEEEVAESLIILLNDKELRERLGQTGRQRVLDDFSADTMAERVLAKLADL
ncbi:MAG: glycosyltransferase family 4 protein [Anaerolineae bacterium]|nr:glycosyltransferase family 4 protein [Anaerolineae bacterium]